MSTYLRQLIEKISKVYTKQIAKWGASFSQVTQNDRVVGILSDENKQLGVLWLESKDVLHRLVEQNEEALKNKDDYSKNDFRKFLDRLRPLDLECDVLKEVFWQSVRVEFPELLTHSKIGLRDGWQIVWVEEEEEDNNDTDFKAMLMISSVRGG